MAKNLNYLLITRFILANIPLWISWKRGPSWWLTVAPTFMYLVTLTNYILIPLGSMAFFALNWTKLVNTVRGLYMCCVCFIYILQSFFYFTTIRPFVYFNAMAYIASRKLKYEQQEKDSLSNSNNITVDFG